MELKDPKKPTRKYIRSVLQSEDMIANKEAIDQCLWGWLDAVKDPDRVERARRLSIRSFGRGDLVAIGFCTYVYGYALPPTTQPNNPNNTN